MIMDQVQANMVAITVGVTTLLMMLLMETQWQHGMSIKLNNAESSL